MERFAIAAVPALLGIILHEVAHGWVAERRGDPTARFMGRLTLNPLPHIDPAGLLVFAATSMLGSFVFGWAKPVPINPRYFRNPAKDVMLVALAGPLTNMLLALLCALLLRATVSFLLFPGWETSGGLVFLVSTLQAGVIINFGLAWLNLLPIPPLDGSKILAYFLPTRAAWTFMAAERYGFLILLVLLLTNVLGTVLGPLVRLSTNLIYSLLGLI